MNLKTTLLDEVADLLCI